jgi:hypothetical protein
VYDPDGNARLYPYDADEATVKKVVPAKVMSKVVALPTTVLPVS